MRAMGGSSGILLCVVLITLPPPVTGRTPMSSVIRRSNPPAVHTPLGKYHHATVHPLGNGLKRLVMARQVGIKPDGKLAGDLGGRIEQAYDHLLAVLASEGMSCPHLVRLSYFTIVNSPEA